jgi:hypothetical protein
MRNDKDAFRELQHSLEKIQGNLHVLETNVPVERQMEYFRFSEEMRDVNETITVDNQIEVLNSPDSSSYEIKFALSYLAVTGDVKAYRAIESYSETHKSDWVAMSLMQAKITLESEFSDEKQVFISTGLGGKGNQLRFFAFFKSNNRRKFSNYQKELIEKEIPFCIQNHGGTLENILVAGNYFTLVFLIHIQVDIRIMLEQAMEECNQYGDFINKSFIITNVKLFSEEEIQRELLKD